MATLHDTTPTTELPRPAAGRLGRGRERFPYRMQQQGTGRMTGTAGSPGGHSGYTSSYVPPYSSQPLHISTQALHYQPQYGMWPPYPQQPQGGGYAPGYGPPAGLPSPVGSGPANPYCPYSPYGPYSGHSPVQQVSPYMQAPGPMMMAAGGAGDGYSMPPSPTNGCGAPYSMFCPSPTGVCYYGSEPHSPIHPYTNGGHTDPAAFDALVAMMNTGMNTLAIDDHGVGVSPDGIGSSMAPPPPHPHMYMMAPPASSVGHMPPYSTINTAPPPPTYAPAACEARAGVSGDVREDKGYKSSAASNVEVSGEDDKRRDHSGTSSNSESPPLVLPSPHGPPPRFFVIKSFSSADVITSLHHGLWASTDAGNARLDRAYREASSIGAPVYLLFSVNESRKFCGVAMMTSAVDFDRNFPGWNQDNKWRGSFTVQWVVVKDVPNVALRGIRLPNNGGKALTHSRDTQEVPVNEGYDALQIITDHPYETSLLDEDAPSEPDAERCQRRARRVWRTGDGGWSFYTRGGKMIRRDNGSGGRMRYEYVAVSRDDGTPFSSPHSEHTHTHTPTLTTSPDDCDRGSPPVPVRVMVDKSSSTGSSPQLDDNGHAQESLATDTDNTQESLATDTDNTKDSNASETASSPCLVPQQAGAVSPTRADTQG